MKMQKRHFKISINTKLIGTAIIIVLCSIFLVAVLSYQRYTEEYQKQSIDRIHQIVDQLSLNLDNYIDDLTKLSLSPYNNVQLLRTLEFDSSRNPAENLQKERLIEGFLDTMIVTPRIDILRVYLVTDRIYTGGRSRVSIPPDYQIKEQSWYKQALVTNDPIFIPSHKQDLDLSPGVKVFSIAKQIRSIDHPNSIVAVIKVDANYSVIDNIFSKVDLREGGGLVLMDENEEVIYSSIHDIDFHRLYKNVNVNPSESLTFIQNQREYLVTSAEISRAKWKIISINSVEEMNRNALATRNFTIIIAFVCSIIASLVFYFLIRSFLRPFMRIVSLMKEVKNGNFSVRFPDIRSDEIGYLGHSFNTMVTNIQEILETNTKLTKDIYEMEFLQKEAQINALYSQIRPHFIYNTLNTITALIQLGNMDMALVNIKKLSIILRGFANVNTEITIESEMNLLEAYLSIQQSRYKERLDYRIEIDSLLHSYKIPAFISQPIVENCVIHGCEEKKGKTFIHIFSRNAPEALYLCIEDNGNGMEEQSLSNLLHKLESDYHFAKGHVDQWELKSGIGLVNVNRRIKIFFGDEYGIHIRSQLNVGTLVEIKLPHPKTAENLISLRQ